MHAWEVQHGRKGIGTKLRVKVTCDVKTGGGSLSHRDPNTHRESTAGHRKLGMPSCGPHACPRPVLVPLLLTSPFCSMVWKLLRCGLGYNGCNLDSLNESLARHYFRRWGSARECCLLTDHCKDCLDRVSLRLH
eukprot:1227091-Amphidinium_carterae.1